MYKILFKGSIEEELVETTEGVQLMQLWENNALPEKIQINGSVYDSKSIKAIIANVASTDGKKLAMKEMMDESVYQHHQLVQKRWAMIPKERAQHVGIANMIMMAFRKRKLTPEETQEVITLQEKFFEEHPTYAWANPIVYKHVIGEQPTSKTGFAVKMSDLFPNHALRTAELAVANGIKK